MSESIAEKLSRFTPDPAGLDRASVLFAAGRASARPNRGWIALAGSLAAMQLLTLVLLWPQPVSQPGKLDMARTPEPAGKVPAKHEEPEPPAPPMPSSLLALQQNYLEKGNQELGPIPTEEMAPSSPPLRAFPISADVFPN